MDPFSAEGELTNLHTAFHTSQHAAVVAFDISSLSSSNIAAAKILQLRSRIALGQYDQVIKECANSTDVDHQAVKMFAKYLKSDDGDVSEAINLSESSADNLTVQLLAGTVMAREGQEKEALALLGQHQGSLDAVALIVQIHLMMYRLDLAQQEVRKARSWAQDHLLVNIAESWVGLREGGSKYQPAFYVYEELATAPANLAEASNTKMLLSQAICELHLGRLPEAEAAMNTALEQSPDDVDVIANAITLNTIAGKRKEASDLKEKLEKIDPSHILVRDLQERRDLFSQAMGKYNPVFEVKA